jgi:hypothetical protein
MVLRTREPWFNGGQLGLIPMQHRPLCPARVEANRRQRERLDQGRGAMIIMAVAGFP